MGAPPAGAEYPVGDGRRWWTGDAIASLVSIGSGGRAAAEAPVATLELRSLGKVGELGKVAVDGLLRKGRRKSMKAMNRRPPP